MFRIDDPSAAAALPTPGAAGTEGYFTPGNPGSGIPATLVTADFLNMLQEELRNVVVAGGLTPSKTTYNQLLNAIKAVALGQFSQSFGSTGYVQMPNGFLMQWGNITTDGSGAATITYPVAFTLGAYSYAFTPAAQSCVCRPLTGGLTTQNIETRSSTSGSLLASSSVAWIAFGK